MTANITKLLFFMFCFVVGSPIAYAVEKHALIIANKDYIHGGSLTNPIKDSRILARSLKDSGFNVKIMENLTLDGMRKAISDFGWEHSETDNVAMVYYSGHGAEFDGENYLIPVDAKLEDARRARSEAITLSDVQNFMYREISDSERSSGKNAKGLNIIVLDACRNNPYPARRKSASRGLGEVEGASGTLIWYAAQPGAQADDGDGRDISPFADAFTKAVDASAGESVEATFKQVASLTLRATEGQQEPWMAGNILGNFSFKAGGGRKSGKRYLAEFDPAQIDQKTASIIPRLREWRDVRQSFGDWNYGSMGKYVDGVFVSIGGIWQETGSRKLPYVVIEPIEKLRSFFFLGEGAAKPSKDNIYGAGLRYVFPDGFGSESISMNFGKFSLPTWWPLDEVGRCYHSASADKDAKNCHFLRPLSVSRIENTMKTGNEYEVRWDPGTGWTKLTTVSLRGSSKAFDFNKRMNPLAQKDMLSALREVSNGKGWSGENLRQCVLEFERFLPFFEMVISEETEYVNRSAQQIKQFYEAGDRECAFAYGVYLSHPKFDTTDRKRVELRRGVELMLEGMEQEINLKRTKAFSHILEKSYLLNPKQFDQFTVPQIVALAEHPALVSGDGNVPSWLRDLIESRRRAETRKLAGKARFKCRNIVSAIANSEKLACYEEFSDLFPDYKFAVAVKIAKLKQGIACASATSTWEFLSTSNVPQILISFANQYPTCKEAELARQKATSLEGN
tara:strand:+ start:2701 stop:4908 length:2208 start_codon:yes stop_codon:yes gene_type:complete